MPCQLKKPKVTLHFVWGIVKKTNSARQINDFLQKRKQKKIELVARPVMRLQGSKAGALTDVPKGPKGY